VCAQQLAALGHEAVCSSIPVPVRCQRSFSLWCCVLSAAFCCHSCCSGWQHRRALVQPCSRKHVLALVSPKEAVIWQASSLAGFYIGSRRSGVRCRSRGSLGFLGSTPSLGSCTARAYHTLEAHANAHNLDQVGAIQALAVALLVALLWCHTHHQPHHLLPVSGRALLPIHVYTGRVRLISL